MKDGVGENSWGERER